MNKDTNEKLSALMDGELSSGVAHLIIDEMKQNDALKAHWSRYHIMGDVMRNNFPKVSSVELSSAISKHLEDEPIVLAPTPRIMSFGKPLAGLAIAASVAIIAIIGVKQINGDATRIEPNLIAEHQRKPAAQSYVRWDVNKPAVEKRLNNYLVNHNERLGTRMQGLLPYVRIVTYNASQ